MLDLNFRFVYICCLSIFCFSCEKSVHVEKPNTPKLVVQITIDGLRKDLLDTYAENFADDGGFNYLMQNGAYFTNAHYQHANTETIVGHTTLATGTYPSIHGMVGNVWYDHDAGELGYNIEDPRSPILPTREEVIVGAQIDPAQKASRTQGRSPRAILASTISDEMFSQFNGQSKIFGISGKDRSAVSMAGHQGKAFWFSTDNGDFISSKYYYDEYPSWVKEWNSFRLAEKFSGTSWELLKNIDEYVHGKHDDRPYEVDLKGYGRVFPHSFGEVEHPLFHTRILVGPKIDELTLDFAKTLIENESVGQDDIPDYLSVSFSGVDAVNHFFGPSSLENEDVMLQLDQTLKELFTFIDKKIGLENVLIAFSADHGMPEIAEYRQELGFDAGRIYGDEVLDRANRIAKDKFGIDSLVKLFFRPSLYLNDELIKQHNLYDAEVEKTIADQLTNSEGIGLALGKHSLDSIKNDPVHKRIMNTFHPERSGDIYVVQAPYWFMLEGGSVAVMHGSPWEYDTHVPIIFVGNGIRPHTSDTKVHPVDVAPTIASYLGIAPPKAAVGSVILNHKE